MHFRHVLTAFGALSLVCVPVSGQETAGVTEELRQLRKSLDQQAKQIEMLTREVARLGAALEGKAPGEAPRTAPAGEAPAPAPAPSTEEFAANPPPKAEPAHPRHIVVKGDTLTSIAKQYNITIADLQKANKEVNERKLQIGQSLNLPPNAQTKAPAATPEPKPNP